MFQISVKKLQQLVKDDTLFVPGTRLDVNYERVEEDGAVGYLGKFELSTKGHVLLKGEYLGVKAVVNQNIAEDVIYQLLSRGQFLLYHVHMNNINNPNNGAGQGPDKGANKG